MAIPGWVPISVDIDRPNMARVYDYYLGGSHNFRADRDAAQRTIEIFPEMRLHAQVNRAFLRRAVRTCVEHGITQFLDVGSGIPTAGNVHTVAQEGHPNARVVYVDVDPVTVLHGRRILAGEDRVAVLQGDVREPERILADADLHRVLDLARPVALLLLSVLHYVPDEEDPAGLVGRFRDALAPGSYVAIAHGTDDDTSPARRYAHAVYGQLVARLAPRSHAEVAALFDGFDLLEPGVTWAAKWRPEPDEDDSPRFSYVGVGRKP